VFVISNHENLSFFSAYQYSMSTVLVFSFNVSVFWAQRISVFFLRISILCPTY